MTQTAHSELWRKEAPQTYELSNLALPALHVETLANGITLHWLNYGQADVSRLSILMPGGELESAVKGIASLSVDLLREGSGNFPDGAIADVLESNGAWMGSDTQLHWRRLTLYALNNRLKSILPTLVDMLHAPTFEETVLESFKQRVALRNRTEERKVSIRAAQKNNEMMFGKDHPIAHNDTPEDILNISRSEVAEFHSRAFDTSKMHVFFTGKFSPEIFKLVKDTLESLRSSGPGILPNVNSPQIVAPSTQFVNIDGAQQNAINIGIPAIGRIHQDYVDLRLAVIALGGNFGSRLNTVIREEKGLTYGIHSSLMGLDGIGAVSITSQTAPENVNEVIESVGEELRKMALPEFTDEELLRLQRYMLSSMAATLESPFSVAEFHESMLISGIPSNYWEAQIDALAHLTPQKLSTAAATYLRPEQMRIAVAGQ